MKQQIRISAMVIITLAFIITGCGGKGSSNSGTKANTRSFLSFGIENPSRTGIINQSANTVSVTVPYGTSVTNLVAVYSTSGVKTAVNGKIQTSGSTSNNFSSPVTYTITAEDGTTADYVVTVTIAEIDEKSITSFSINNATGTISGTDISIRLPNGTDVTNLTAYFSTSGKDVKIGSTSQVSGSTSNNFTNPVTYIVEAADGSTKNYIVTVLISNANSKLITSFIINGAQGSVYEWSGDTAYMDLTLPHGTDVTNLAPVFTTTGKSVTVDSITQISGITINDFSDPVTYIVTASDGTTQAYEITVNVAAVDSKEITYFSINGVDGDINGTNITVLLPYGTSLTSLAPDFAITGKSVTVNGTAQISGSTPNDFSSSKTYIVAAADNSTVSYSVSVKASLCKNFMNLYPIYEVSANADGSNIYALPLGGLYISTNSGSTWTNVNNGASGLFVSGSTIYIAYSNGISISSNNGSTWAYHKIGDFVSIEGISANGSTIYAASQTKGLFVSGDNGSTWTNYKHNYSDSTSIGYDWQNDVHASADGTKIYVALNGEGLSVSTNSGTTWTTYTTADGLASDDLNKIFVSTDGTKIYAATDAGLSVSLDSGASWTNYTTADGLGSNSVNDVYGNGNTICAATDNGLSVSKDSGSTWTNYTEADGLGENSVYGVHMSGTTIYAATWSGVSVFPDL